MQLSVVVEGRTDVPLARCLAKDAGFTDVREHVCQGKAKLDSVLAKYLAAAQWRPYLILRDLESQFAGAVRPGSPMPLSGAANAAIATRVTTSPT